MLVFGDGNAVKEYKSSHQNIKVTVEMELLYLGVSKPAQVIRHQRLGGLGRHPQSMNPPATMSQ